MMSIAVTFMKGLVVAALVLVPSDALVLRDLPGTPQESRPTIWVHAFARSGSSTVLSLVSENDGVFDKTLNQTLSRAFTIFEPCRPEDDLSPALATKGCVGMLKAMHRCDFSGIKGLHGWSDIHTKKRGVKDYTPELAENACQGAELKAFKTITKAFEKFQIQDEALALLEEEPNLHMLDVIRDPRSIYTSWMNTFPFNDTNLGGVGRDVNALLGICDTYAANLHIEHPRIHRLKFEALIKDPWHVTEGTYEALGLKFGPAQQAWIKKTFNAKDCPGVDQWIAPYSDCHTKSDASLDKWQDFLMEDEKIAFNSHESCQLVANTYGYKFTALQHVDPYVAKPEGYHITQPEIIGSEDRPWVATNNVGPHQSGLPSI